MKKCRTKIVLGLGFGDEGKGLVTNYLCSPNSKNLVVRFSGGHQAGHTVMIPKGGKNFTEKRHVFSQFGSGTLNGASTYWSKNCTFYPPAMVKEHKHLIELDVITNLFMDPLAPMTSFYDVFYNRALELARRGKVHGSCGMGVGATYERHESFPYKLYAQDILFPELLKNKLEGIEQYYKDKIVGDEAYEVAAIFREFIEKNKEEALENFLISSDICKNEIVAFLNEKDLFGTEYRKNSKWDNIVFEGSQGILLDMDFGFFPNVTRSNTTSKLALEFIERNGLLEPEIFYVTRAYTTRHGAGWIPEGEVTLKEESFKNETNVKNDWQGELRYSELNPELIRYAINCDDNFSNGLKKNLVVTCLDQLTEEFDFPSLLKGIVHKMDRVWRSDSPYSENIKFMDIPY